MRLHLQSGFGSLAWFLWDMRRAEDVGMNVVIAEGPQALDEVDTLISLSMMARQYRYSQLLRALGTMRRSALFVGQLTTDAPRA